MKRVSIIFLSLFLCNIIFGQSEKYININRNDGGSFSILQKDVDSIVYSSYDIYGHECYKPCTQIVFSNGKMYRIPINSIDSVSINQDLRIKNNEIYYHVESNLDRECGIDSIMVASNGYYYVLLKNNDQTVSLLIDSIYGGGNNNPIIARFDSLGNIVSVLTNEGLACFSYRDNLVDIFINNNGVIESYYNIKYSMTPTLTRGTGGVPQYHFWDRINKVYSIINIFQSADNPITFFTSQHSLFWQSGADALFKNSEASFAVSIAGEAFEQIGEYGARGSINWLSLFIGGSLNLLKYGENKVNDLRIASYKKFAGNCKIETLGHEKIKEDSYTFKLKVSNLSSIPNEYKNKNYYGLIVKKVPLNARESNITIYDEGANIYYFNLTKEGILDITINSLEKGYKYYYDSFIMTPVEEDLYKNGTGNKNLDRYISTIGNKYFSWIYYGGEKWFIIDADPIATTGNHTNETTTTATIECSYENVPENADCGYYISKSNNENSTYNGEISGGIEWDKISIGKFEGSKIIELTDLMPDEDYEYYAYISVEGKDVSTGETKSFVTETPSAFIIGEAQTNYNSATIKYGFKNVPDGGECMLILLKVGDNPENAKFISVSNLESGNYTISGLESSTSYEYFTRIEYKNRKWDSPSTGSFTTNAPPTPSAITGKCTETSKTSATVSCTYENVPEGGVCGVEYTWKDGSAKQAVSSANGTQSITLNDLQPGTSYTYCAYIEANGKTYYGENKSFTTEYPDISGTWNGATYESESDAVVDNWTINLKSDGTGSAIKGEEKYDNISWNFRGKKRVEIHIYSWSSPYSDAYRYLYFEGDMNDLLNPTKLEGSMVFVAGNQYGEFPNGLRCVLTK